MKKGRTIRRPFCQRNYGPINEFAERLIKTILRPSGDSWKLGGLECRGFRIFSNITKLTPYLCERRFRRELFATV
jgi:hypothetical protein